MLRKWAYLIKWTRDIVNVNSKSTVFQKQCLKSISERKANEMSHLEISRHWTHADSWAWHRPLLADDNLGCRTAEKSLEARLVEHVFDVVAQRMKTIKARVKRG